MSFAASREQSFLFLELSEELFSINAFVEMKRSRPAVELRPKFLKIRGFRSRAFYKLCYLAPFFFWHAPSR